MLRVGTVRRHRLLLGLVACTTLASAAPPRMVGLAVQDEKRMLRQLERLADCDNPAFAKHVQDGIQSGRPFRFFTVGCEFGNTFGESQFVAFHDGKRYTRVLKFYALGVASPVSVRKDRIVYEAVVPKPGDARCCPSGRAEVEIDVDRLVATKRAIGFHGRFEPARGTALE